jgi:VanZ family protein
VPLGLGLAAYGAVVEVLQATLPINRDGDVRDWVADAIGIGIGLSLSLIALRLGARARPPRSRPQSPR